MSKLVYYVAISLDGYIAGKDEDISQFVQQGAGVDKYLADLQNYRTVVMGRKTYEFGYKFGLEPGQPAYPHMQHYIFSNSMQLDSLADNVHIEKLSVERVKDIAANSSTDVYICGGGEFAAWLLENDLIDCLKVKLHPVVLGQGTRIFGDSTKIAHWKLTAYEVFEEGLQIITYNRVSS